MIDVHEILREKNSRLDIISRYIEEVNCFEPIIVSQINERFLPVLEQANIFNDIITEAPVNPLTLESQGYEVPKRSSLMLLQANVEAFIAKAHRIQDIIREGIARHNAPPPVLFLYEPGPKVASQDISPSSSDIEYPSSDFTDASDSEYSDDKCHSFHRNNC